MALTGTLLADFSAFVNESAKASTAANPRDLTSASSTVMPYRPSAVVCPAAAFATSVVACSRPIPRPAARSVDAFSAACIWLGMTLPTSVSIASIAWMSSSAYLVVF